MNRNINPVCTWIVRTSSPVCMPRISSHGLGTRVVLGFFLFYAFLINHMVTVLFCLIIRLFNCMFTCIKRLFFLLQNQVLTFSAQVLIINVCLPFRVVSRYRHMLYKIYHLDWLRCYCILILYSNNMTKLDVSKGNLRANLRLQLMRLQTEQEEKKNEQTPSYSQSYRPAHTAPQSIQIPAGSVSSSTEVPTRVLTVSIHEIQ